MAGSYNLGTASGRIVIDGSQAEKGFGVAEAAAQSFRSVVQEQMDAIDRLGNKLLLFSAGGSTMIGALTHSAAAFEKQLSGIEAVSGATEAQMDKVAEAALRIGARTVYSATESAAAMEELIKAGISVEDVLAGAADATVDLAAAGGIALPRAAEIAANAMNVFDLAAQDMPKIADLIAGAANASAIDVEQFGQSLSQAGAVANLAGVPFNDLAIAIAEMGNAGIKGSDAGTSLKTFLSNLIPTTTQQINKFQELGLYTVNLEKGMKNLQDRGIRPVDSSFESIVTSLQDYVDASGGAAKGTAENAKQALGLGQSLGILQNGFFDTEGKAKSLADMQQILADATGDMTEEQKLANLEILFGSDAIRAAAVLSKEGAAGYNEMADAMGNVSAQDVAATRLDNLSGAIEQLKGSLETLSISIGKYFLKPARRMVEMGTKVVDFFNWLPDYIKAAIAGLLGFGTTLSFILGIMLKFGPAAAALLGHMLGLTALKKVWAIFTTGAAVMSGGGGVTAAMAAMGTQAGILAKWFGTLFSRVQWVAKLGIWFARAGAAIGTLLTGPVGIALAVVGALALAGKILYDKWQPFHDLVDNIGAAVKKWWVDLWPQVVDAMKPVTDAWSALVDIWNSKVMPVLKEAGGQIITALRDAWGQIVAVWETSLKPAFQDLAAVVRDQIMPALRDLWTQIEPGVKAIGILVGILVGGLFFALFKIAVFLLGTVLPAFITFVAWIATNLIPVFADVASWIIQYLITPFIQLITFIASKLMPVFATMKDGIVAAFEWIVGKVGPIITQITDWFSGLFDGAKEGADTAGNVFTNIGQWFTDMWDTVTSVVSNVADAIAAPFKAVWGIIGPFVTALFGFIVGVFQVGFEVIKSIVQVAWAVISGIFEIGYLIVKGIVVSLWRIVVDQFNSMRDLVVSAWTTITSAITTAVTTIRDWITNTWNGIRAANDALWASVGAAISTAWAAIWEVIGPVVRQIGEIINTWWTNIHDNTVWLFGWISGFIGAAWAGIWNIIGPGVRAVGSLFSEVWNSLKGIVSGAFSAVRSAVETGWNNVKSFFNGAAHWLTDTGGDIIQGLINGIKNMTGRLVQAVKDVTGNIANNIKDFFDIASPSKLMIKYGGWITEGLAVGIEKELDSVMSVMDTMNKSMVAALPSEALVNNIINTTNPDLSTYPGSTPTPVLNAKVMVQIGDKELNDIVDTRIETSNDQTALGWQTGTWV